MWKHNGQPIDIDSDSRINVPERGRLIIDQVKPSDAGYYTLTATNGEQCQNNQFVVLVECMYMCMALLL